jgi:D-arabinose 1-dehydrogenase-like Zn-dependent alcohol dehydrogenase
VWELDFSEEDGTCRPVAVVKRMCKYSMTGITTDGGFAETMIAEARARPIPDELNQKMQPRLFIRHNDAGALRRRAYRRHGYHPGGGRT